MENSLWNPVNNLFEGIHKINCNYGYDDKKFAELNVGIVTVFLNTQLLKMV